MSLSMTVTRPRKALIGTVAALTFAAPMAPALVPVAYAAPATTTSVVTVTGYTTGKLTNIRSGPSTANSIVKTVGLKTAITGTLVNGASGQWVRIDSGSYAGKYIALSTLTVTAKTTKTTTTPPTTTPTPPAPPASTVPVSGTTSGTTIGTTNVRSGPGTTYSIIATVKAGTSFTGTRTSAASGTWIKIASGAYAGRYVALSTLKNVSTATAPTAPTVTPIGTIKTPYGCNTRPELKLGSTGECAKAAQYILNSWIVRTNPTGAQLMTITGYFGDVTVADLKIFQTAMKLPATGKVDASTWNSLAINSVQTGTTLSDTVPAATTQTHNAFPSAIKLTDGRLMVVFRAANSHALPYGNPRIYKMYSSDGGYSWTTPEMIVLPTMSNGLTHTPAALGIATSGPLAGRPILTTWSSKIDPATGKATGYTYTYVTVANDMAGKSWGEFTDVRAVNNVSTFSASPIVQVTDTDFQQAVYVFANNGSSTVTVPLTWNGTTFLAGEAAKIAVADSVEVGVKYNESDLMKLPDGRLIALVRDDTVDRQGYIWKAYSSDNGATWTTPVRAFAGTGVPRMGLSLDGKMLAVIYRHISGPSTANSQAGNLDAVYRVSLDNGQTWGPETKVGEHSAFEMSYGTPIMNADGTVTFIYGSESSPTKSTIVTSPNVTM